MLRIVLVMAAVAGAWDKAIHTEALLKKAIRELDSLRIEVEEADLVFYDDSIKFASEPLQVTRARTFTRLLKRDLGSAIHKAQIDSLNASRDLRRIKTASPAYAEMKRREEIEQAKKDAGLEGLTNEEAKEYLMQKYPSLREEDRRMRAARDSIAKIGARN